LEKIIIYLIIIESLRYTDGTKAWKARKATKKAERVARGWPVGFG